MAVKYNGGGRVMKYRLLSDVLILLLIRLHGATKISPSRERDMGQYMTSDPTRGLPLTNFWLQFVLGHNYGIINHSTRRFELWQGSDPFSRERRDKNIE